MKYNLRRNIQYTFAKAFKHNRKLLYYILLYTFSASILPIISLYFPKTIVDEITGSRDVQNIVVYIIVYLFAGVVFTYITNNLKNRTYRDFHEFRCFCLQEYQQRCFELELEKIEDSKFLDKINMARVCLYDNNKGFEGILRKLFVLFGYIVSITYFSFVILRYNPVIFLLLLANAIIPYVFSYSAKKYEYSKQEEVSFLDRKQNYFNEVMSNFTYGKEIRLFDMNARLIEISKNINKDYLKVCRKILNRKSLVLLLNLALEFLRETFIYIFLVYSVINQKLTLGDYILLTGMALSFSAILNKVIEDISDIRAQSLLITDYRIFMDSYEEKSFEGLEIDVSKGCSIDFEHVTFSYPCSSQVIFEDLCLHIEPYEKIAIVGSNGAGKSTFVKLVCGFYKPDKGRILINNVDISKCSRETVLKLISALFQDISIFSMSIAENIAFRNKDSIDMRLLNHCIDTVGIRNKIMALENKEDTVLKKVLDTCGIELSGGEYQKLAMARTLYKNGNIFILDEPTSALDPIAEKEIYNKYNEIINHKTCLFITHRLASTKFCDRILVLQNGKVVEDGNHSELLNMRRFYYEMYTLQASYYNEKMGEI